MSIECYRYDLYRDKLGGWALTRYIDDEGDREHRACGSEARAKAYAKEAWGVTRWRKDGYKSWTASQARVCPKCGAAEILPQMDAFFCCGCNDEWPEDTNFELLTYG